MISPCSFPMFLPDFPWFSLWFFHDVTQWYSCFSQYSKIYHPHDFPIMGTPCFLQDFPMISQWFSHGLLRFPMISPWWDFPGFVRLFFPMSFSDMISTWFSPHVEIFFPWSPHVFFSNVSPRFSMMFAMIFPLIFPSCFPLFPRFSMISQWFVRRFFSWFSIPWYSKISPWCFPYDFPYGYHPQSQPSFQAFDCEALCRQAALCAARLAASAPWPELLPAVLALGQRGQGERSWGL